MTLELRETWKEAKILAREELERELDEQRRARQQWIIDDVADRNPVSTKRKDGRICYLGSINTFVESAMKGRFDVVATMIRNGDKLDARHSIFGYAALHAAAEFGHLNVVHLLLEAGADPNVTMQTSLHTPLHLAAANNRVEIIGALLHGGADKFIRNALGELPIDRAIFYQKREAQMRLYDLPDKVSSVAVRYAIDYEVSRRILTHCLVPPIPSHGGLRVEAIEFAIFRCEKNAGGFLRKDFDEDDEEERVVEGYEREATTTKVPEGAQGEKGRWHVQMWTAAEDSAESKVDATERSAAKVEEMRKSPTNDATATTTTTTTPQEAARCAAHVAAIASKYSDCYDRKVRKWIDRLEAGKDPDPDCADGHGVISDMDSAWRHVYWENILPFTLYRFKARARNAIGWGKWSDVVEKRTMVASPETPDPPCSVATTPTCIVLKWNEPNGNGLPILDYLVLWSREGVGRVWTPWRRLRIVMEAHIRIDSLASDRGYKFRVSARNDMGTSSLSASSAVVVTYQAIDILDITSTSVEVSWASLGYCSTRDVDRFELQAMDVLCKRWTTQSQELTDSSARATNLRPYRLYMFRVRPHSKDTGWKDWADCVATEPIRTLESTPFPPEEIRFRDVHHDSMVLDWEEAEPNGSKVVAYRIRMRIVADAADDDRDDAANDATKWQIVNDAIPGSTLSYLLDALPHGVVVAVAIAAKNACGWGTYGASARVRTMAVPAPSSPKLVMRRLDSIAKVSWRPPVFRDERGEMRERRVEILRYELQIRYEDQDIHAWTIVSDEIPGDTTSHVVDDLAGTRRYLFRVRVFTSLGVSQFSAPGDAISMSRVL